MIREKLFVRIWSHVFFPFSEHKNAHIAKTAEIQSIFSGVVDRLNETFDEFKAAKHQVCSQGVELQVELNTLVENRRKVMKEVNDIGRYIPKKK